MTKSNYDNHHRSFPSYGDGDGPTGNNYRSKISNIYDVLASSSDYGDGVRIMQPFDISASSTSTAHTAFKSPGGMAAPLEFPFTFSQREELGRQVRIYKYIMASVPVPLDLLIPIAGSSPSVPVASRFASAGRGDVEPGRCKRTDGKKWRCSRDVAPDHKYCERHLHRGRPRSRKPVEHPNKRTRRTNSQALPSSSSTVCTKNASQPEFVGTLAQAQVPFHQNQATFWPPLTYKEPRTADWAMNELISMADQQWQMEEPLDLISYPNFNAAEDQQDNSFPWFLNSAATPRGFIDAWSSGVSASGDNSGAEPSVSCDGELSLSSLYSTIGINSITVNEMGPIHMGLGVSDYDENRESASKSHLSSWLAPASTPGGPLAEVLRTSATKSRSNPSSPGTGNGNSCSSPVTAVSSPSGVLQKAPTSLSDSCGSSSPTLVSSSVKPEISLMLA